MQTEKIKNLELKKHVGAIHSAHSMTLVQRKIANGLLYNAYDELMEKDEHQISIKDLCGLIGFDSHDYKAIKTALVNLLSTVIEWNLVDKETADKQGEWNASSIIADASIKGSICSYSYSKRMKDLLYRPEIYGRLNMAVQAKFKSSYGLALYENCIRYQNLEYTPWFDFVMFRRLMGVEEGKYVIFRDFKRRVLDKAVNEVNDHASITIVPHLRKTCRKIIAIRFLIESGAKSKTPKIAANEDLPEQWMQEFGLTAKQAQEVLSKYEHHYIAEKIKLIQTSRSYKEGKINNLAKYLLEALAKDFQAPRLSRKINTVPTVIPVQQQFDDEREVCKKILTKFATLIEAEKIDITQQFEAYLGEGGYLDTFREVGLKNTIIADKFCFFMRAAFPNFL